MRARASGKQGDGQKLGLVVEGGAMRGVIAAGAVLALERIGTTSLFDSFYGISAGSIIAAYFAAGQAALGTSIFYEDLASNHFISAQRLLSPRPIMNLHHLEEVILKKKRLDSAEVISNNFNVFALNTETARSELLPRAQNAQELSQQLLAACTMPFLCHSSTEYGGKHYIDGGLHTSVPWKEALADGCSDIVVLLTRPPDSPRPSLRWIEKKLVSNDLAKKNPALVPLFLERVEAYNENIKELQQRQQAGEKITIIAPAAGTAPIRSMEKSRRKLVAGAISGAEAVYRALFGKAPRFAQIISPVSEDGHLL